MKILISFLTLAAALYLALGLVLYFLQGSMVFLSSMPGRELDATPADIGLEFEDVHIDTEDGERLHAWFVRAASARGTLLFFHGNAGNISHRLESIAIFNRLGLDVLIVDYRGYGQSTGSTTEAGTYLDAAAAWDYLVFERGLPANRIVLFGRSLGGAVAAWLGSTRPPGQLPAATIIESCFSSGAAMAQRLYPFYPARLLTRLRYPAAAYAEQLGSPVLVVHSRDDEIIPFGMGREIFEAVSARKDFVELRGDHNAGFWISRDSYVPALDDFLGSVIPSADGGPQG
jgi:fermentation-respiration switch protein FrsA (DUF1100 family)